MDIEKLIPSYLIRFSHKNSINSELLEFRFSQDIVIDSKFFKTKTSAV